MSNFMSLSVILFLLTMHQINCAPKEAEVSLVKETNIKATISKNNDKENKTEQEKVPEATKQDLNKEQKQSLKSEPDPVLPKEIMQKDEHQSNKARCSDVICSPPPKKATCTTSTNLQINPIFPMIGSNVDCCPVHICVREDGSIFTHYALEGNVESGFARISAPLPPKKSFPNFMNARFSQIRRDYPSPPQYPLIPQFRQSPIPQQQQFGPRVMPPFLMNMNPGAKSPKFNRNAFPVQQQQQQYFPTTGENSNGWEGFSYRPRRNLIQPPQQFMPGSSMDGNGQLIPLADFPQMY